MASGSDMRGRDSGKDPRFGFQSMLHWKDGRQGYQALLRQVLNLLRFIRG